MIDLIERMRDRADKLDRGQVSAVVTTTGELLREAADALEAAQMGLRYAGCMEIV